ncbi:undecaprenyl-phosphate glucose phosphotransferase, partial [Klebsiella pneumoniae]
FVIGYFAQLFLHFAVRELQKRFTAHARLDNALIIGNGDLANFLYQKISNNPWFGERVLGCVVLDKGDEQGPESAEGKQRLPVLGHIGDLDELVARHGIRTVYLVTPLGGSEV